MERIASFCVDHTRLLPGMYLSRQDGADGEILTWDIRMKQPNKGSYLSPAAAHTLEHLFATYARNSKCSRGVVYVGPMGCLTGFYLLTTGLTPAEALDLTRSAFAWMAEYEGEIPGASAVECGNYLMMDPIAARADVEGMGLKNTGGYIFYSLGNFSFGGNTAPRDVDTAIAQVTVKKDGDSWAVDDYDLIPCRLSSTDSKNDYCPRPYKEDEEGYTRALSTLDGSWTGSDLSVDYSFMYR